MLASIVSDATNANSPRLLDPIAKSERKKHNLPRDPAHDLRIGILDTLGRVEKIGTINV